MSSSRLNPLDASWLYTESRETPMHVGALLPFRLPENAPKDFLRQLMADFRKHRQFAVPWNRRLKSSRMKSLFHEWVEDDEIDLEVHVRHAALPYPGGERELGELIASVKSLDTPPFWASGLGASTAPRHNAKAKPERDTTAPTFSNAAAAALEALRGQIGTVPQLVLAFGKMLRAAREPSDTLRLPFGAPASILNGRVRSKRRFATQQFALERMKTLAAAAGCTLNDIVLATCGGALRHFLEDSGDLPASALTAGLPVSARPKDDDNTGNAITFIIATLGTDIDDPVARLAAIRASVQSAKAHVQSLPRQAMTQYTVALMAPTLLGLLTGLAGRTRPMFNITISNVPGPNHALYFRGAELLGTYPASIVTHGQALNITCHSYNGTMAFGFTGCHASLPHMQRIAVYTGEAFEELERLFLAPPKKARPARRAGAQRASQTSRKSAPSR